MLSRKVNILKFEIKVMVQFMDKIIG